MSTTRESADAEVPHHDAEAATAAPSAGLGRAADEEETLFPIITADLTLARQAHGPRSQERSHEESGDGRDGEATPPVDELSVAADDPRRETVDDPRIPADKLFFKIGEVSKLTGVKPYVLRYWETEFPWIRPSKTSSGQRLYRRQDIGVLLEIRRLRHEENRTIADTKEQIRERRGLERARRPSKPPRKLTAPPPASAGHLGEVLGSAPDTDSGLPSQQPFSSPPGAAGFASSYPPSPYSPGYPPAPSAFGAPSFPSPAVASLVRELRHEVADLLAFVDGHAAHA